MRRAWVLAVLAIAMVFAFVTPAAADYGTPPPGGEGDAVVGNATPTDVNPGDTVTFDTGAGALDSCTKADVFFVRGLQDATSEAVKVGAPVSGGSLSVQFAVPAGTPAGIYFVYASCTDSNGNIVQSVAVVAVFTAESPPGAGPAQVQPTQADASASQQAAPAAVETPPAIAAMQASPDTEKALLSDAAASGGQVTVISGKLAVSKRVPSEAGVAKSTAPIFSVILAVLAVMSLVVLRRRRRAA